jgi:hypothetical protein
MPARRGLLSKHIIQMFHPSDHPRRRGLEEIRLELKPMRASYRARQMAPGRAASAFHTPVNLSDASDAAFSFPLRQISRTIAVALARSRLAGTRSNHASWS